MAKLASGRLRRTGSRLNGGFAQLRKQPSGHDGRPHYIEPGKPLLEEAGFAGLGICQLLFCDFG